MKEILADLIRNAASPQRARNLVREYLQARILEELQRCGALRSLAFQGGTALRFLYAIARHSEDLDFALEHPERGYDLRGWLRRVRATFAGEGYEVAVTVNDKRTVHGAFVRFRGLLAELDLASQKSEVLAIKVEVDTRPPRGAVLETTVVRRHVLLQLNHHDRASLFAGRLHAILQRPFAKGRDLYDLLWYLTDTRPVPPNLTLLNNALAQTGWTGEPLTGATWTDPVRDRLRSLDWKAVVADVRPFLEDAAAADLLTPENLLRALDQFAAGDPPPE